MAFLNNTAVRNFFFHLLTVHTNVAATSVMMSTSRDF
jgi:hypothetical protein